MQRRLSRWLRDVHPQRGRPPGGPPGGAGAALGGVYAAGLQRTGRRRMKCLCPPFRLKRVNNNNNKTLTYLCLTRSNAALGCGGRRCRKPQDIQGAMTLAHSLITIPIITEQQRREENTASRNAQPPGGRETEPVTEVAGTVKVHGRSRGLGSESCVPPPGGEARGWRGERRWGTGRGSPGLRGGAEPAAAEGGQVDRGHAAREECVRVGSAQKSPESPTTKGSLCPRAASSSLG